MISVRISVRGRKKEREKQEQKVAQEKPEVGGAEHRALKAMGRRLELTEMSQGWVSARGCPWPDPASLSDAWLLP